MDLKKHVIEEFSSKAAQEMYIKKAAEGLWSSEKELIKKYFKPKSTVLDIGCGTGRTTIPLFRMKYRVTGIDLTPAMIKNAKKIAKSKRLKIPYQVGDATRLKFRTASFDNALFSNQGWTQIPGKANRVKALKEVYRVLKPGSYYIFTSHVRRMKGFTWFWLKQWTKTAILKPLGFKIDELDFGDRFFERETRGTQWKTKQYIHIPNVREVKKQIADAGFMVVHLEKSKVVKKEHIIPPMFYVCKKPE